MKKKKDSSVQGPLNWSWRLLKEEVSFRTACAMQHITSVGKHV